MRTEERRAARDRVLAGICPYCGAGPFRSPASHVYWAHGVTSQEMREELGLDRTAVLVDADLHEQMSEIRRRVFRENPVVRQALERCRRRSGKGISLREQAREAMSERRSTPESKARFKEVMKAVPHEVRSASCHSEKHLAASRANISRANERLASDPEFSREVRSRAIRTRAPLDRARSEAARVVNTCTVCGKEFETIRARQRPYCSHECYAQTVSARWTPEFRERITAASLAAKKTARKMSTCVACGRQFWPGPNGRRTCSETCLVAAGYDPVSRKRARKQRFCSVCGRLLPPKTYRRTCSEKCRHEAAVLAGKTRHT